MSASLPDRVIILVPSHRPYGERVRVRGSLLSSILSTLNPGASGSENLNAQTTNPLITRHPSRMKNLSPQGGGEGRVGFTLLEVLLTSLLASIVLLALWSLSNIYLKMFASGKRKVEETQLVRGLTGQLAKDVSQVIQLAADAPSTASHFSSMLRPPSVPGSLPNGFATNNSTFPRRSSRNAIEPRTPDGLSRLEPAPVPQTSGFGVQQPDRLVPRFGLFGTKQALRLIVLQTDPRTTRGPAEFEEIVSKPGQSRKPLATELRTIQYTFAPPHESAVNDQQHPSGLVRREWAWETWAGLRMASLTSTGAGVQTGLLPESHSEWNADDVLALQEDRDLFHVPQVVGLEFRYYDGQKWEVEWDSWERQKLPRLVEVLLKIKTTKDEHASKVTEQLPEDTELPLSLAEENSAGNSSAKSSGHGSVYRRLIHLPFAEGNPGSDARQKDTPIAEMADSFLPATPLRSRQR